MSIFNLRRNAPVSKTAGSAATQPESVEAVRKRARQRLIGAAVLVLAGVIGFPLLFDTQPRPVAVDIAIEIPSRNTAKSGAKTAAPAAAAPVASAAQRAAAADEKLSAGAALSAKEEIVVEKGAKAEAPKPEVKAAAKPDSKPETKPEITTASKAPAADDAARAQALLEGKAAKPSDAAELRLVVQVGAFADADKARDARAKLEKAGLKTYTHVADTKDGKRTRVRVGPYATKAEAEKAAAKVKSLDLPAAILTL
ncbi:MAG: SPOR domain-containing protein [Pseudomonadota bacterium]